MSDPLDLPRIHCNVIELQMVRNSHPVGISPWGPDTHHGGVRPGCTMVVERYGSAHRYHCHCVGPDPFPEHWEDFELFRVHDGLVGSGAMIINGLPYVVEMSVLHFPVGTPELLECRYTCLDPTKEHDGSWHSPL